MYTLHVFRKSGDKTPLDQKEFNTDILAETYFWESTKPYLDDSASFIITDNDLTTTYPDSTVPVWAIIYIKNNRSDLGVVINNGAFLNHGWLNNKGNIEDVLARTLTWYDLETNNTYTANRFDVRRMTQEEWDNLTNDQQEQLLNAYKTKEF